MNTIFVRTESSHDPFPWVAENEVIPAQPVCIKCNCLLYGDGTADSPLSHYASMAEYEQHLIAGERRNGIPSDRSHVGKIRRFR